MALALLFVLGPFLRPCVADCANGGGAGHGSAGTPRKEPAGLRGGEEGRGKRGEGGGGCCSRSEQRRFYPVLSYDMTCVVPGTYML